jgi:hypothetical protein
LAVVTTMGEVIGEARHEIPIGPWHGEVIAGVGSCLQQAAPRMVREHALSAQGS